MERLLAIKEIPLFKNLSLDQLEAVQQSTKEVEYLPGEVILKQGERGDELFMLLEGRVRIFLNYGLPNEEDKGEQEQQQQSTQDKLEEMNISEDMAKMILEALRNNEVQYIQQQKRKPTKKQDSTKPDW